jgi:hypothetical protein
MCKTVNYYPKKSCVAIKGELYSLKELEEKTHKTRVEKSILHTLKEIILLKNINSLKIVSDDNKPYLGMRGNGSIN